MLLGKIINKWYYSYDLKSKKSQRADTYSNILWSQNDIKNAGELLELGVGVDGALADEIAQRVYECFKDEEYI